MGAALSSSRAPRSTESKRARSAVGPRAEAGLARVQLADSSRRLAGSQASGAVRHAAQHTLDARSGLVEGALGELGRRIADSVRGSSLATCASRE